MPASYVLFASLDMLRLKRPLLWLHRAQTLPDCGGCSAAEGKSRGSSVQQAGAGPCALCKRG